MPAFKKMLSDLAGDLGIGASPFRLEPGPPASAEAFVVTTLGDLDLRPSEVKEMWWFFDGSVNVVEVRHHLWRSWGFCSRHAWAFALAAAELRAGLLQPAVLYEDLVGRAAAAVRRARTEAGVLKALSARDSCFTCDYCARSEDDPHFSEKTQQVNLREESTALVVESAPVWRPRSCPQCLGGQGIPCRPHLLSGDVRPPSDLAERLSALAGRMHVFRRSLLWRGPSASEQERASWVEVLGFFAGWAVPEIIASTAPHHISRRVDERRAQGRDQGELRRFVETSPDPYLASEALRTLVAGDGAQALRPWLEELAADKTLSLGIRQVALHALRRLDRPGGRG